MTSKTSKLLLFILMMVVVIGGGLYVYFLHFQPLQQKVNELEGAITKEKQELAMIDETGQSSAKKEIVNTSELQQKIPVQPLTDQIVLSFEEAEVASGTLITSLTFQEGEEDEQQSSETEDALGIEKETENTAEGAENLPGGVKQIQAEMTVISPSYKELETFVKEIEQLPRMAKVESLQFAGTQEARELVVEPENLSFQVVVSFYYYPELEELVQQLPNYEAPPASDKENPLYEPKVEIPPKTEMEKGTVVEKDNITYEVFTYKVQPGDTLFRISMRYYNSREGEALIKKWNNMTILMAGTNIEVPVPVDGEN
ncbi:LysM peptidoglycan-binding domain-containing protein [Peribacillus asahii]|uniref:LysM peptidoglycan-binding domain-containing protein n=1 Tax=Peribacillus asahii TaxID=228899 RepID=UPI0020793EE4|nr:LysM domain-containing protein [Peribacillus asahii]USK69378.1 LysM peptidoglycan-binding domain-containing protein [Peribacillus asahii]